MSKNCLQIQKEILSSDGVFSPAIERHCAGCENCRRLKFDWQLVGRAGTSPEIRLTNDFAVITAARKFTRSRKRQVMIRRVLGYAAAAASGIAALYTVMFHEELSAATDNIFRKAWNWDTFEERVFVLDTATEISRQDITVGSSNNDELDEFIEKEISVNNI